MSTGESSDWWQHLRFVSVYLDLQRWWVRIHTW
jgi:hypothetical protein